MQWLYWGFCTRKVVCSYEPEGYNGGPDPGIIRVKDQILRYFPGNRLRYNGDSRNIYDIWLKDILKQYGRQNVIDWTDDIDGKIKPESTDGFMNIPNAPPFL